MTLVDHSLAPLSTSETEDWNAAQRRYWTGLAGRYDSLYSDPWPARENELVALRLGFLRAMTRPLVVDLAAGTGLGRNLVREVNPDSSYIGVDLTRAMLAAGDVSPAVVSAMDRLALRSAAADVVICLFTSCSFAADVRALFAEVERVLRPGGIAYLSVLSGQALSRLRSTNQDGRYRTRGDDGHDCVPVHLLTRKAVTDRITEAGLVLERCEPLNALSGFIEITHLWHVGAAIGRVMPGLSHSLELTVRKQEQGR